MGLVQLSSFQSAHACNRFLSLIIQYTRNIPTFSPQNMFEHACCNNVFSLIIVIRLSLTTCKQMLTYNKSLEQLGTGQLSQRPCIKPPYMQALTCILRAFAATVKPLDSGHWKARFGPKDKVQEQYEGSSVCTRIFSFKSTIMNSTSTKMSTHFAIDLSSRRTLSLLYYIV